MEKDPLEFNDGIGDMLRFGKRQRKKWWRVPLLFILGILILSLSFVLSYELGKILFLPKTNQKTFVPENVKEPQFDELEQEFAYKETKNPTKNIKSAETATKNEEKAKETKKEKTPTKSAEPEKEKAKKEPVKIKEEKTPTKSVQKTKIKEKTKEIKTTSNINNSKDISYKVITGSFSKKEKALEEARSLLDKGFSAYVWQSGSYWKIQIGSFKNKELAESLKKKAAEAGHPATIIND